MSIGLVVATCGWSGTGKLAAAPGAVAPQEEQADSVPKLLAQMLGVAQEKPRPNDPLPVAVPGIRQPSFLAPHGVTLDPIAAGDNGRGDAANQASAPANAYPATSGWSKFWQHLLGGTAQPPPNRTAAAAIRPPASKQNNSALTAPGAMHPGGVVGGAVGPPAGNRPMHSAAQSGLTEATAGTTRKSRADGPWQQAARQSTASNAPSLTVGAAAPRSTADSATAEPAETRSALFQPLATAVVGSEDREGVVSALWRPLALKQDAPQVARPNVRTGAVPGQSSAVQPGAAQPLASQPAGGLENSPWLQPFYLTNASPSGTPRDPNLATGPGSNQAGRQADASPPDAGKWATGFLRQFSMSSTEDLRTPPTPVDSAIKPEPQAWNQGWTVYFPSFANPFALTYDPSRPANLGPGDTQLVAFLQESLPLPDDLDLETGESIAPGEGDPAAGQDAQAQGDAGAGGLAEAESLGKEPEDNSLEFLRAVTVLLKPGESQFDVGLTYLLSESDFPVLLTAGGLITGVDEAHFRVRELAVPMEYRLGLTNRVQGFIGVPVGWANTQVSIDSFEAYKNDGGIGDVDFGLTMQLVDATVDSPYWVATIAGTAPTGGDPFTGAFALAPAGPSLGQGFWSIGGSLLFIQPYDPIVVFYGLGTRQYFSRRYVGVEIEPGAEYSYLLGVGFAVNDRVTLSSRFRGSYVEEIKVDGERILGANLEPMTIRFSATIAKPCDRLVEPFVEFGLTDDSISSFFGVTWTY